MKRGMILFVGLALALTIGFASQSQGGAKRITKLSGALTLTNYADTGTDTARMLSDRMILTIPSQSLKYDHMYFGIYVPEFTDPWTADSDLGELDSAIVRIRAATAYRSIVLAQDSLGSLPGSLYVAYHEAETPLGDTTGNGAYRPGSIGGGLALDLIWIDLYASDSAGVNDSITLTATWWMRLIEDE